MAQQVAVQLDGVRKAYGGNAVLDGVGWSVLAGEIHGLVGENGAGKSTLIKIVSGATSMSSGKCAIYGQPQTWRNSLEAQAAGIQTVFQELTLIPDLSVARNIFHVRNPARQWQRMSNRRLVDQCKALFDELQLEFIDPLMAVRELPLYLRQMLEVAKALVAHPRLLLLDEATSALLGPHVDWLFERIQNFKRSGGTVIFTSHRWDEVKRITDRISVMRNGRIIETLRTDDADEFVVTRLMTGKSLDLIFPGISLPRTDLAMSVSKLTARGVHEVSFDLYKGEVLGVGGLSGQGQRELFLSMFGAVPYVGMISVGGQTLKFSSPRDAIRNGVALIPEDRKVGGVAEVLTINDNIVLPTLRQHSNFGFVANRKVNRDVAETMRTLRIQGSPTDAVSILSGGNQQKVVLSKWLVADIEVFLLYDVTRGVDIGTKHDIYQLIATLAGAGKAVLFFSTETLELVHLTHRVIIMYEGKITDTLQGERLTFESVVGRSIGTAGGESDDDTKAH